MDQKSTLPTLTVFCVGMLHTHVGARGPSQQKKKINLRVKHTLTVVYTLKPLLESVVDTDSWISHHGWAVIPVILRWNPSLEVFACLVHYKVNSPWTRVYKKWFDMWATAQSFALTIWWWCLHLLVVWLFEVAGFCWVKLFTKRVLYQKLPCDCLGH